MLSTWQRLSGKVQLHTRVLLYKGISFLLGVLQFEFPSQGLSLKSQSFFPNWAAISLRASTANQVNRYQLFEHTSPKKEKVQIFLPSSLGSWPVCASMLPTVKQMTMAKKMTKKLKNLGMVPLRLQKLEY